MPLSTPTTNVLKDTEDFSSFSFRMNFDGEALVIQEKAHVKQYYKIILERLYL